MRMAIQVCLATAITAIASVAANARSMVHAPIGACSTTLVTGEHFVAQARVAQHPAPTSASNGMVVLAGSVFADHQPLRLQQRALQRDDAMRVGKAWQHRQAFHAAQRVVDPHGQFEQALMNLFQSAADATAGVATPELRVSARLARGGRLRG